MILKEVFEQFKKIKLVKQQHKIKEPNYYNEKALKRDCLRVWEYIDKVSKGWLRMRVPVKNWRRLPREIKATHELVELVSIFSKLCDIIENMERGINKIIKGKNERRK